MKKQKWYLHRERNNLTAIVPPAPPVHVRNSSPIKAMPLIRRLIRRRKRPVSGNPEKSISVSSKRENVFKDDLLLKFPNLAN